jgi:hypothetical protein
VWSPILFGKIIATSLADKTKAVLGNLTGAGSGIDPTNPEADQGSEFALKSPFFTALGIIARARPPSKLRDGTAVHAEHASTQDGGGMTAFAYRDLRLNEQYPAPPEGVVALVGYGGGYLELADAGASGDQRATKITIAVPYQWSGGTPAKTHRITIDPDAGSIKIQHGDGVAIELTSAGITLGASGGAIPVARATPLVSYLTALETLLGTIASATTPSTASAVGTFVTAQATNKTSIPSTTTSAT